MIRRVYEAVNTEGLDAVTRFADPDLEFVPPTAWPDRQSLSGIETIKAMARQWIETFDHFRVVPDRLIDAGDDQVVAYVHDRGQIKGSGVEIENRFFHLWTIRDGKLIRWQSFMDESKALEAAGLSQ